MPLELQIIRASEFVRVDPKNHLDMHETKKALVLLARACCQRGIDQAMMDLRQVPIPEKPLFTPTQIAELVNTFQHAGFGNQQRLAILYRSDPHHGARMFAFISKMRGCQVQAFQDFERALQWLSEVRAALRESGQEVPVHVAPKSSTRVKVSRPGTHARGH